MKSDQKNLLKFLTHYPWWGKLLGAFFGFLVAGGIGALFGIFIGNFFDIALIDHYKNPYWYYYHERREAVQALFFRATFSVIGYIAKSDGRVSEQEIQMAKLLMDEMRLSHTQKQLAQQFFNAGKDPSFDLPHLLTLFEQACYNNHELLTLFMDIQYRAAKIGGFSEAKQNALDNIFLRLGFAPLRNQYRFYEDFGYSHDANHSSSSNNSSSSQSYQESYSRREQSSRSKNSSRDLGTLGEAYALLEIGQESSKEDVRRAYRRLISRNHPDKLIAKGLPESMIKVATDKTQRIRKAYEQICTSRGWQF